MTVLIQHQVFQLEKHTNGFVILRSANNGEVYRMKTSLCSAHLQVTVNNLRRVQVIQRRNDLSAVETGPILRKHAFSRQMKKQLQQQLRKRMIKKETIKKARKMTIQKKKS